MALRVIDNPKLAKVVGLRCGVSSPPIPRVGEDGKPATFKLACVSTHRNHYKETGDWLITHVAATKTEHGTTWIAWTDADLVESTIEEDL